MSHSPFVSVPVKGQPNELINEFRIDRPESPITSIHTDGEPRYCVDLIYMNALCVLIHKEIYSSHTRTI